MKKPFDIRDVIEQPTSVSKSRIKLGDERTGERTEIVTFHPGDTYPVDRMRSVIGKYGYSVISCEAEDTVTGKVPWNEIYSYLERGERLELK